jgi:hypothetical protein
VALVDEAPTWLDASGPVLVWDFDDRERPPVQPSGRILDEFVRLPLVDDEHFPQAVLEFAGKYGTLGLCRHGKPRWHPPSGCINISPAYGWHGWPYLEPIAWWRRYTRHMRALLMVAAQIQSGGQGRDEDWDAIIAVNPPLRPRPDWPDGKVDADEWFRFQIADRDHDATRLDFRDVRWESPEHRPTMERLFITHAAQTWLQYGKVELDVYWTDNDPHARSHFMLWDLPAVLAVFFLAAIQGPLYVCAGCGSASRLDDERQRRPRRGTKFWCGLCGRAAQKRLADRRRYLRRKSLSVVTDSQPSGDNASASDRWIR